ncbi:hypothetical protein XA68_16190 [Ophiocordyceps unilateralis]|uniref:CENP-V/GFA domain-containing protein n=1 Tax=Ophiocordyceps unilateralis TaxID=268505 RepID=A0A2A9P6N9_OPHUN|nr:hypothetical protein XA68_16190 [Ophiocordyceps unilateralis]
MSSADSKTTPGSCLCGKIRYELTGEPSFSNLCYCNSCRKVTGAIGMANSVFKKENFKLLSGAEHLRTYHDDSSQSGAALERTFCASCGSTMMTEHKTKLPDALIIPFGSMDVDPSKGDWVPSTEFFCKWKPSWLSTPDDTKKYHEQF